MKMKKKWNNSLEMAASVYKIVSEIWRGYLYPHLEHPTHPTIHLNSNRTHMQDLHLGRFMLKDLHRGLLEVRGRRIFEAVLMEEDQEGRFYQEVVGVATLGA